MPAHNPSTHSQNLKGRGRPAPFIGGPDCVGLVVGGGGRVVVDVPLGGKLRDGLVKLLLVVAVVEPGVVVAVLLAHVSADRMAYEVAHHRPEQPLAQGKSR